jgi:hypothetical protein
MAGKKQMTRDEIRAEIERLEQQDKRMEARETLPKHPSVGKVNQAIQKATVDTGANEIDVRLAEIKNSEMDFSEYYRELKKVVDEWMEEHATYRNPDNPEEYWYSPEGKGNPPKWIINKVGGKPKTKKRSDMDKWLKKLEPFRVKKRVA